MRAIIFDHVRKVVVQVKDAASEKQFQDIVAAQRPTGQGK